MVRGLHRKFFGLVHGRRLIYNTCWEDPRIDRNLLELGPDSSVVVIKVRFQRLFTKVPFSDNYFWRVYLTGSYTSDCCPEYLSRVNFAALQERVYQVTVHNATITRFLQENPGRYSHFVLLDHQDWLAWHDTASLLEKWQEIFANSRPGARILLRSAGPDLRFLPENVTARLRFFPELTGPLHERDRVGTYGSLHLAEVT